VIKIGFIETMVQKDTLVNIMEILDELTISK